MLHLPQILYLFRTLPIPIPKYFFKSLQMLLNKCIWKGSKPRIAITLPPLLKHKSAGCAGTIDFADYYTASLLGQLTEWFHPCPAKIWNNIENLSLIRQLPLYTVNPKAWEHLTNTCHKTKGISLFYNILHHKLHFTKSAPHTHWENDLGQAYTNQQWQRALQSIYKATKCSAL